MGGGGGGGGGKFKGGAVILKDIMHLENISFSS